jgi:NAD(P)H-quinone oxidoreductase subunit 5
MVQFLLQTSWLVPGYGLVGTALTLPWSMGLVRQTGPRPAAYFNLLMTLLAFVHGTIAFQTTLHQPSQEVIFHWLSVADLDLVLTFRISTVTIGAMELVTGLSLLAQLYALGYMEKDWSLARFFGLMGFFEGAMSGLVLSDSLLLSYGLLEMLTLSTYLLVGFWYAQPLVVTAARDAFLTKRVGDILLLMGVVTLATLAGSLNFPDLYVWADHATLSPKIATLLGLALIAGPIGKCAQFPLNLWLDEAMEGPNPASILRNSVVVSCGAYILIKLQPIVSLSPVVLQTLTVLGAITAVGSSLVAIAQIDIKRTLSHSTSAYMGLVFMAVGLRWTDVALLILLSHAIAKALLFMSIGSIILTTNNQDLRELGGLWNRMPATTSAFVVGSLGLVGLLPLGGFWALVRGLYIFRVDQPGLVLVLLLVNGLSALNLTRVFRLAFLGPPQPKTRRTPEVAWPMAVPMVILIVVTLFTPALLQSLSLLPATFAYINRPLVLLLILSGIMGCSIGATIPLNKTWSRPLQKTQRIAQDLLAYDFYVDRIYHMTVVNGVTLLSKFGAWLDRYIVDGLVNFVGFASIFGSESLKYSATGQSQSYALTIIVSVGLLISLFFYWSL